MRPSITILSTVATLATLPSTMGYSFTLSSPRANLVATASSSSSKTSLPNQKRASSTSTTLQMVELQTLQVGAIAFAGLSTGIGLLAFTDNAADRSDERGGLNDGQKNKIIGGLVVEEVEDGKDAGSLASQLENALKQSGTLSAEKEEEILDDVGKDYDGGDGW
mmetsp:Transcript_37672/g.44914  ORF Transcript_37672/g.44914 Transcript_37672/m.44914 type:complete len:164 (+) Transcript_37672:136-627(+)